MERRAFLGFLFAGVGTAVAVAASPSQALTRLAPLGPVSGVPTVAPESGVATPEDMERAKIEKSWWYRRYYHRRRRYRRYYYYRPRHYYRRHYWHRRHWW